MGLGLPEDPEFQSHAGSIEASIAPVALRFRWVRFNPTLVRLRPGGLWGCRRGPPGFNPTLVRLRHVQIHPGHHVGREFQSHAGSIEA